MKRLSTLLLVVFTLLITTFFRGGVVAETVSHTTLQQRLKDNGIEVGDDFSLISSYNKELIDEREVVTIDWAIEQEYSNVVESNDFYFFVVPKEFVPNQIVEGNLNGFGDFTLTENGEGLFVFNETVKESQSVGGSIEFERLKIVEDSSVDMSSTEEVVEITGFKLEYHDGTELIEIKDGDVIDVDVESIKYLEIAYDMKLTDNDIEVGSTYEINLPTIFEGVVSDVWITITRGVTEYTVAKYSIANKKITITFEEDVNNLDKKELQILFQGDFNTEVFEKETEVIIEVPIYENKIYTATIRSKQQEYEGVDKKTAGSPYILNEDGTQTETNKNPTHVDWTVRVNDTMGSFENATVIDDLGAHLEIVEGSFKIERLVRNYKNEIIGRIEVADIEPTITEKGFELVLGNISDAYDITYMTRVLRPDGGGQHTINNTARIILGEDEKDISNSFEGTWSEDIPVIEKTGNGTSDPHLINWVVNYNFGREDLGTVTLTDTLGEGDGTIDLDSLKMYQVQTDIDGNIVGDKVEFTPIENNKPYLDDNGNLIIPNLDAKGKAYYITFSSSVPVGLNGTIENTISDSLDPQNTDNASVPVNTIPGGEKVGEQGIDEYGRPYIDWTITMNTSKINVDSITVRDVFNPSSQEPYWEFDIEDTSLFKLTKDGNEVDNSGITIFTIEDYTHTNDDREPSKNGYSGFKLVISNAGPHEYKFMYRTYYTVAGMQEPELANDAELVFLDGSGAGIGTPIRIDVEMTGPKAGIEKSGKYITSENKDSQEIEWTVTFNNSKIMLEKPEFRDIFISGNYEYIDGSLIVLANGEEFTNYEFNTSDAISYEEGEQTEIGKGFILKINENTNAVFTISYRTTVDDLSGEVDGEGNRIGNRDHTNKAILKWQGGSEEGKDTVEKRTSGLSKDAEVKIDEDGNKTIDWTIDFNTERNVLKEVVVTDIYYPATKAITNLKVFRDGSEITDSVTITYPETGGFKVELGDIDAVPYQITYSTTLTSAEEMGEDEIKNDVKLSYTGDSEETYKEIPKPTLGVQKKGKLEKNTGVISWKITANTDTEKHLVTLVEAILTDTIPIDQRLVVESLKIVKNVTGSPNITQSLIDAGNITTSDNSFEIKLPTGAFSYTVTFDTIILEYPSVNLEQFDRYTNETKLVDGELKATDNAYIDYFDGNFGNLIAKNTTGQDPETENMDWEVVLNAEGLTIYNPEIIDTLDGEHSYYFDPERNQPMIQVLDKDNSEIDPIKYNLVVENNNTFTLTFTAEEDQTPVISEQIIIKYSTRVNPKEVGSNIEVGNEVVLKGGTEQRTLVTVTESTTAQQWFYGGGGSGTTVRFELTKQNSSETPLKDIEFDLYLWKLNATEPVKVNDIAITTNENGIIFSGDIRAGRYVLKEEERDAFKSLDDIYLLIGYKEDTTEEFIVTITDENWKALDRDSATSTENQMLVTNEYKPTFANIDTLIKVNKSLNGQPMLPNQFRFVLKDETERILQRKSNQADGTVVFEKLEYDKVGTYSYTISEANDGQGGMEYDDTVHNVVVSVSYVNGAPEEGIEVSSILLNGEETIGKPEGTVVEFSNTYTAEDTSIQFNAFKELAGQPLEAEQFSFVLREGDNVLQTGTNAVDGKVVFDEIVYNQEDHMGQQFVYTISEVSDGHEYMAYDETVYIITVDVVDNRNGTMRTEVLIIDSKGNSNSENIVMSFTNTYTANPVEVTFDAHKVLEKQTLEAGQFEFTLTGPDSYNKTFTHDVEGKILFDAIEFTEVGEYVYTLSEVNAGHDYMIYDSNVYTITVTITDDREGQLVASVEYSPTESVVFENTYNATPVTASIGATKLLSGQTLTDGRFTFNLVGDDGAVIETVTNNADGYITFSDLSYDEAGVHTYTIEEVHDGQGGITYHKTPFVVTVTITDNREGDLTATVEYEVAPEFKNYYSYNNTRVTFDGKKVLEGRPLTDGEFEFVVKQDDEIVQTVKNAQDGTINFEEIEYTQPGTYTYVITEVNTGLKGITYDENEYTVVVTVRDNHVGQLVASVDYNEQAIEFTNHYAPDDVVVTIEAHKELKGSQLTANRFIFHLLDADGEVVAEAKNDKDGKILFDDLLFNNIGEYHFKLIEVDTKEKDIIYDDSEYEIVVTVSDNLKGELVAEISHEPLVFVNTSDGDLPPTGVTNEFLGLMGSVIVLLGLGVIYFSRRKKHE